PTAIPQTLRLHRGCPGILPPLLHLVQPGSPSRRHRIDDPGPSALRPGQGCPCRPPGRPGAGIPSKPGTLRTQNPRATAYAYPDLDQPTPENRNQPSLNRDVGCLKVIDTFRQVHPPPVLAVCRLPRNRPDEDGSRPPLPEHGPPGLHRELGQPDQPSRLPSFLS